MEITLAEINNMYLQLHVKLLSACEEIELCSDYYWCAAADERENLDKKPTLCVGSLEDDWAELIKILPRAFASLVDAQRFANILISIGEAMRQQNKLEATCVEGSVLRVSTQKLFDIFPYIIDAISLIAGDEINVGSDLYWTTLSNERENVLADPTLVFGSLKNDWSELEKLLHSQKAKVDDLDRFANVLIFISEAFFHKS